MGVRAVALALRSVGRVVGEDQLEDPGQTGEITGCSGVVARPVQANDGPLGNELSEELALCPTVCLLERVGGVYLGTSSSTWFAGDVVRSCSDVAIRPATSAIDPGARGVPHVSSAELQMPLRQTRRPQGLCHATPLAMTVTDQIG